MASKLSLGYFIESNLNGMPQYKIAIIVGDITSMSKKYKYVTLREATSL